MRKCRFCAEEDIQDAAVVCKHCGRDLIPGRTTAPLADEPTPTPEPTATPARGYVIRKLVWSISLLAMLVFAADGFFTFQIQTGAPQQGAAAAAACFHMITVYVITRALDELTRERPRV